MWDDSYGDRCGMTVMGIGGGDRRMCGMTVMGKVWDDSYWDRCG